MTKDFSHDPNARALLTCKHCWRSITVPLRPGPGNDPSVDLPDDWRMWFVDDHVEAECPDHVGQSRRSIIGN